MTTHRPGPVAATTGAEPKSSPRSLHPIESLRQHARLAFSIALAVIVLGLPAAWWKGRPTFRTEGVLFVSPRFLRNLDTDPEHEIQSNSQYREFVQQQVRTINRYDIVANALPSGSPEAAIWTLGQETPRRATDRLRGALQISPVPDTYQITVALEGEKAAGLAEVINKVMESYVRTAHRELLYDSDSRLRNLDEEKQEVQAGIDKLIDERAALAQELGTTVFSGAIVNSFDKQLGGTVEALADARRQRFLAEAAVTTPDATRASALQSAMSDTGLNGFKSALNTRKAELLTSIRGLGPQHAGRIAAEKEIRAIDQELEAVTASLQSRLAGNLDTIQRARQTQATAVEQKLAQESQSVRQQTESYYRGYQRSLEVGEELDRLRKRLNAIEVRISYLRLENKAPGFVRVFSPAMTPEFPISGGRTKLGAFVLLAALALALLVPLGIDYLDPRLRAPDELQVHLGLPITGWVPIGRDADPAHVLRAAVSIRRQLHLLKHQAIVVSALDHGGGSTTLTLALALALQRLGIRALVVEANALTRDARYEGHASGAGLTDWLAGGTEQQAPIAPTTTALPPRIATGPGRCEDLLPVERLITLLDTQCEEWDVVLIDAAPLPASLATEEFVRVFGASLLIVDAEKDSKTAVSAALNKLDILAPSAFGAILNKVPRKRKINDTPTVLAA
jgi:Mrp family chromosome partitioning ATPase/capsular polysaccharide biosynthesis protein